MTVIASVPMIPQCDQVAMRRESRSLGRHWCCLWASGAQLARIFSWICIPGLVPVLLLVWAEFDFFYLYSMVLYRPLFLVFSFLRWAWLSFDSAHGPTCERKVCTGEAQSLTSRCTWSKTISLYPQPACEIESTNNDFGRILNMFKLSSMPWVPSEALALKKTTAG